MGFLGSKAGWGKLFSKVGQALGYTPFTGFGVVNEMLGKGGGKSLAGQVGGALGVNTPATSKEQDKLETERKSAADAASKAAAIKSEQDTMSGFAAELARLRRKRGFASTMLSSNNPGLGSGAFGAKTLG